MAHTRAEQKVIIAELAEALRNLRDNAKQLIDDMNRDLKSSRRKRKNEDDESLSMEYDNSDAVAVADALLAKVGR